jgi:thioredoxin reductase (NADPH)
MAGETDKVEKLVIIGSGPAGHTAAIYAARALLEPVMYEGFMAGGVAAGGQLTTTTEVENFPGFPTGISGPELMQLMREQSTNSGARVVTDTVDSVDLAAAPFRVRLASGEVRAEAIIIATGATAKRLEVTGTDRLWQRGISACAVCDGALPVFRNRPLVVVGGGDTAAEEATYLTKFASSVTMLVRRDQMRASKAMQRRVAENEKINIRWNSELHEVLGDELLNQVRVKNTANGVVETVDAGGLFFAIGHEPNTAFLGGQLDTDETGYLLTRNGSMATSRPGVFACGDVQDKVYRQAVTAAGTGCMAALEAERYLTERA